MKKKITKAVIPAAGLGTRFLPVTKAVPYEMLPLVDKPAIQYIVEEAVNSGIEDIIIVTGKGKRAIEDHFDKDVELEDHLFRKGKFDLLDKVRRCSNAEIHYIRQKEPRGLGHAIWTARNFIGNEPFAVLLGDDVISAEKACLEQLMEQYELTQSSVVGVQHVPASRTHCYGIIEPYAADGKSYKVKNLVEKPKPGTAPSNLAIMGRYILTPEIFCFLDKHEVGAEGEIQLTDAIQQLSKFQEVFAYEFEGKHHDVGAMFGFIQATIEFALESKEYGDDVADLMHDLLKVKTATSVF